MSRSVFDLFKLGIGPSSSHTMGPITAANQPHTTQKMQLAFEAGMTRSYVRDPERGTRNPSVTAVARLAKSLTGRPGGLIEELGSDFCPGEVSTSGLLEPEQHLVRPADELAEALSG